MTIRTGADYNGHHSHMYRTREPTVVRRVVKRKGIKRAPRERLAPGLPIAERHATILLLVGDEPVSAKDIAEILDANPAGVSSGLYALQDRGLVARVPYKGWIRT